MNCTQNSPKTFPGAAKAALCAGVLLLCCAAGTLLLLSGCGGQGGSAGGSGQGGGTDTTSGPALEPSAFASSSFNAAAAVSLNGASIDISSVAQGYVAVSAQNQNRLKFQVINGGASYSYDLSSAGEVLIVPLNMGDGLYDFRVMQNTTGINYVEIASVQSQVVLNSEFEPYLRPNVYCSYAEDSECVALARELAADAANQGDVLRAVYSWIAENISYDTAKAEALAGATGYLPNPDTTLRERSGICFDYVSLGAAMLRSQGIPCMVVTGYVAPNDLYHAWNMVYLNGSWVSAQVSVEANTWTRIDLTFAAAGGTTALVGDGTSYTERYTY